MSVTNIISKAQEFARSAHGSMIETTVGGVARPRTIHLQEVADLVWVVGGSDEEITAAWLHDCLEDTLTTIDSLEKEFGNTVAGIVNELTDSKEIKDLPILIRKQKQAEKIKERDKNICLIKLADQISNVRFLAIDPTNNMTFKECVDYVKGAKLIADVCRGQNILLDKLFDSVYARASKRYGSL